MKKHLPLDTLNIPHLVQVTFTETFMIKPLIFCSLSPPLSSRVILGLSRVYLARYLKLFTQIILNGINFEKPTFFWHQNVDFKFFFFFFFFFCTNTTLNTNIKTKGYVMPQKHNVKDGKSNKGRNLRKR